MGWSERVAKLVAFYASGEDLGHPFYLFSAAAPAVVSWPADFPRPSGLLAFYGLCGGGRFGSVDRFLPAEEVPLWTGRWVSGLVDDAGQPMLRSGQHVVFANDADGTPWILDATTGGVASYYFKGGSWEEPTFDSFDKYMEYALSGEPSDSEWQNVARAIFG